MGALPGIGTSKTATPRKLLATAQGVQYLPGGKVISGANSRDPNNTGDLTTLRAGMVMGKRTNDSKYAPSILGVLTTALAAAGATAIVSAAEGDEVGRRIVAGGLFKIVGTSGAAVDEVQTFTTNANATGGTFTISFRGDETAQIAYDATATEVNTAIALLEGLGAGDIVMTAGDEIDTATTIIMTLASTLADENGDIPMLEWDVAATTTTVWVTGVRTTTAQPLGFVFESRNLSFSAEAAGSITLAANSAVAEIQTCTTNTVATAGTWTITFDGQTTAAIAFDATQTEINAAMDALSNLNTADCVLTAGDEIDTATTMVFTFASTVVDPPMLSIDVSGLTGTTSAVFVETTPGELVAYATTLLTFGIGSLVMPLDGSEVPKTIISKETGIAVIDQYAEVIDIQFPEFLVGGQIAASNIINYPPDNPTRSWLKDELKKAGNFVFDDDF